MKTLRFLACIAVIGASADCSSKGGSATASEGGAVDAGDGGGDAGGSGDPDAADLDGGCPATQICGSQCCVGTQVCAQDSFGNPSCTHPCMTSGTCPMDAPCCLRVSADAGALCMPDPQVPQTCLCDKESACGSNTCAPAVDSSGQPTGPYVCGPDDGSPYRGCVGPASCSAPYCCVTDKMGNKFCAMPCSSDSSCGSGHCDPFDFSASGCSGDTKACGT